MGDQNITLAAPLQRQVLGVSIASNACEAAVVETMSPQVLCLAINPKVIKQGRKIRAAPRNNGAPSCARLSRRWRATRLDGHKPLLRVDAGHAEMRNHEQGLFSSLGRSAPAVAI
jgi:hypothetical protein